MRIEKLLENQTQVQRAKFQHCSLITSSSEAMSVLEPYINPVKEKTKNKNMFSPGESMANAAGNKGDLFIN